LQVLVQQKNQASTQTSAVSSQSHATSSQIAIASSTIKQREVDVEDAKLTLSYTVITAPEDGLVSKVNVQAGQFVSAGQALFSIVLNQDTWVVANFKETQFDKMKVGQKVLVHADAFPGHSFEATVASFAAATGARFALLPPDNSSGNFVKVVQRLPVKIQFTQPADSLVKQLIAGMNVTVDVHLD
jgi:membrane fusion protein (multidrug efflux system)